MTHAEHNANTASTPKPGLFATLGAFLHTKGSGVAKTRLLLPVLVLIGLLFSAAPALAAAPEAPLTESASSIAGTTATFRGELVPATKTEKVLYHFAYSAGETAECTESGMVAPGEPFPEAEDNHKKVTAPVTGLEGSTYYTVCLLAANPAEPGESTTGSAVKFKTLAERALVSAGSENTSSVKTTEARLEATVNAESQSTECHFQYGKTTVTENVVPCEAETPGTIEGGEQGVGVNITGLAAATTYHYRVVVKNGTGESKGTEATFETVRPPSEVEAGVAESPTTSSALLPGKLNAGGEATYYFEYGTAPCTSTSCGQKSTEEGAGSRTQEPVATFEAKELKPDTVYHYRLVATNAAAAQPVYSPAQEFKTLLAGPTLVEAGEAQAATPTSASFTGELNPGGEATYYFEYGTAPCAETACGEQSAQTVLQATAQEAIATPVAGLQPNTVYHYRLVAVNASGSVDSVASQFRTPKTPGEEEAEAAAARRPGEEIGAANAANAGAEAQAASGQAAEAAAAAAAAKQYAEITGVTQAALLNVISTAPSTPAKATTPKASKCKKGFVKKHGRCVKSKKKKRTKAKKSNRRLSK